MNDSYHLQLSLASQGLESTTLGKPILAHRQHHPPKIPGGKDQADKGGQGWTPTQLGRMSVRDDLPSLSHPYHDLKTGQLALLSAENRTSVAEHSDLALPLGRRRTNSSIDRSIQWANQGWITDGSSRKSNHARPTDDEQLGLQITTLPHSQHTRITSAAFNHRSGPKDTAVSVEEEHPIYLARSTAVAG